jgi:hypothetical protein
LACQRKTLFDSVNVGCGCIKYRHFEQQIGKPLRGGLSFAPWRWAFLSGRLPSNLLMRAGSALHAIGVQLGGLSPKQKASRWCCLILVWELPNYRRAAYFFTCRMVKGLTVVAVSN